MLAAINIFGLICDNFALLLLFVILYYRNTGVILVNSILYSNLVFNAVFHYAQCLLIKQVLQM